MYKQPVGAARIERDYIAVGSGDRRRMMVVEGNGIEPSTETTPVAVSGTNRPPSWDSLCCPLSDGATRRNRREVSGENRN